MCSLTHVTKADQQSDSHQQFNNYENRAEKEPPKVHIRPLKYNTVQYNITHHHHLYKYICSFFQRDKE